MEFFLKIEELGYSTFVRESGSLWAFPMYAAVRKSLAVHGLGNYTSLISDPDGGISIPQTYLNSVIIGALHATLVLAVSVPAGYAFARGRFPGRRLLGGWLLFSRMVPPVIFITSAARSCAR